jgi:hypothetical protein
MKNAYLKIIHIWICISPIIGYLLKNKFRFLTVYAVLHTAFTVLHIAYTVLHTALTVLLTAYTLLYTAQYT